VDDACTRLILHGKPSHLAKVHDSLRALIDSNTHTSTCAIARHDPDVPSEYVAERASQRARELGVQLVNDDGAGGCGRVAQHAGELGSAFYVRALGEELLDAAVTKLELEVANAERDYKSKRDSEPSTWQAHDSEHGDEECAVFPVVQGTVEWRDVEERLNSDGFSATVTKVERVQHKMRWEKFADQRNYVARGNGGNANELRLWHGTGGTASKQVATSASGIDPIYSAPGYYGRGSYFAEEADYSDRGYAHNVGDGLKELLLVRVLAGKVDVRTAPDGSIRVPNAGCHSIKGPVKDSQQAYIVYEPHRSYPEYIVTYRK